MSHQFNSINILRQALTFRHKTIDWLCEHLNASVLDIMHDLTHLDTAGIQRISNALDIPEAYFRGGFRIENGSLIEISPA